MGKVYTIYNWKEPCRITKDMQNTPYTTCGSKGIMQCNSECSEVDCILQNNIVTLFLIWRLDLACVCQIIYQALNIFQDAK